jgi:MipA family protein
MRFRAAVGHRTDIGGAQARSTQEDIPRRLRRGFPRECNQRLTAVPGAPETRAGPVETIGPEPRRDGATAETSSVAARALLLGPCPGAHASAAHSFDEALARRLAIGPRTVGNGITLRDLYSGFDAAAWRRHQAFVMHARATDIRLRHHRLLLAAALCCCILTSRGAEKPLWELGLGAGTVAFSDYRGADSGHAYPVPVLYAVYRGRFLKADRDGVRGEFFNNRLAEFKISVNATTPVSSRRNDARAGMPYLEPTFEIGPELDVHLWRSADQRLRLDLDLPVRRAIEIKSSPHAVGWFVAPCLDLDVHDIAGHAGWDGAVELGPLFADGDYHRYFYSVAPQYATAARPAYQAVGGYSGAELFASASKRFPTFWVFAFARYDTLVGAVFLPSPLVRRQNYWQGGFGIARIIGKSSRRVPAVD